MARIAATEEAAAAEEPAGAHGVPPCPTYCELVASDGSGAGQSEGSVRSLTASRAPAGDASSEPLEREVTEGAPSRPPRSSANAEPPCRSERPPDEGPSCDRADPRSDRGESCDCVEATDMVEGESRPSRGVMGGVAHVRGDAFGHERGVSSPATEPAVELAGDERRECALFRLALLRCWAWQNSLKSTTPLWLMSAARKTDLSLACDMGFAPVFAAASSASIRNSFSETTPSLSRSCCSNSVSSLRASLSGIEASASKRCVDETRESISWR